MKEQIRRRTIQVRAMPEMGEGVVEAYAAVFGVEYRIFSYPWEKKRKERIDKGAFADSLKERESFPIFWEHEWADMPVGATTDSAEDDKGLKLVGQLFIEDDASIRRLWRSMDMKAIQEWSIGFIPETIQLEEREDEVVEVIKKAKLVEMSSVVLGANPETETVDVRSEAAKLSGVLTDLVPSGVTVIAPTEADIAKAVRLIELGVLRHPVSSPPVHSTS